MPEISTVIVGTRFRSPESIAALSRLVEGTRIELIAEPDNPHDADAVACCYRERDGSHMYHLGYIPRNGNARIAVMLRKRWITGARVTLRAIVDGGRVIAAPKIAVGYEEPGSILMPSNDRTASKPSLG